MLLHYHANTIAPIAEMGGVVVLFGMAAACGSLRIIPSLTGLEWIALIFCGTVGEREFCCFGRGRLNMLRRAVFPCS